MNMHPQSPNIDEIVRNAAQTKRAASVEWGEPEPLGGRGNDRTPYPVDSLPPVMRDAVTAYQRLGQQPVAMVASSALASASLVCQALANVRRDWGLEGVSSLYFLTIADSGERKSACDKRMSAALRHWQDEQRDAMAPEFKKARARLTAWEAQQQGIVAEIRRLASGGKAREASGGARAADIHELEQRLIRLEEEKPALPVCPDLFREDTTQEALAKELDGGWPSTSLWSDEAGVVIGSHGMNQESILRFVSFLNRLWDGSPFERRRATSQGNRVSGRRFTVSLMAQPAVAQQLRDAGNGVPRTSGGLARFLICWPEGSAGTRPLVRRGRADDPALQAWDARLVALLAAELPITNPATMELEPPVLPLSPDAFEVWREFHDAVEATLGPAGENSDLKDFGSKCAEQAARLACVMHVFEHGPSGDISAETMTAGCDLAHWYLGEARRLFDETAPTRGEQDARLLLAWMQGAPENNQPTLSRILTHGPARLRKKDRRDAALAVLEQHNLCRLEQSGAGKVVAINPALEAAQ